jgi:hypothetical protein
MKKIAKAFGIFLMTLALIPGAYADSYKVIIKKITQASDTGDVVLLIKPGEKEDGFSGKAKGVLLGTDLGTNKALAVVLTATSMEKEVIIEVETMPTSDVIQTITSVGYSP